MSIPIRVVSHRCLHRSWRSGFSGSYLSCTNRYQHPISSYSKAPWGLSVLSRVTCIFTGTIISPGLSLRQYPSRCTFRAGQNLPDKEFRYLRTVIVTAAVYWGFDSKLLPEGITSPLNLPAPGRCQPLYVTFRFCRDLCFC